jgi:glutamate racemase
MDDRAIGVFDSGLGGLTVSRALLDILHGERIVYFGDTARVPYGSKSREAVLRYSEESARFLMEKDVKCIVIACNTATAIALPELQKTFSLPLLGVIEAGAARALSVTKNGRIGVIGTVRTRASGAYSAALHAHDCSPGAHARYTRREVHTVRAQSERAHCAHIEVHERACPLLVPLIEEGWLDHEATKLVVREYLDPLLALGIDTLILGCTHYPLLADLIHLCYPEIALVDSASSTASALRLLLEESCMLAGRGSAAKAQTYAESISLWVSDYSDTFHKIAERILQSRLDGVIFTVRTDE